MEQSELSRHRHGLVTQGVWLLHVWVGGRWDVGGEGGGYVGTGAGGGGG